MKERNKLIQLETETAWFALASVLDFVVTFIMLNRQDVHFIESNPVAGFFLDHWGVKGLLLFKLAASVLVMVICQIVARSNLTLAKAVLYIGTIVITAVVIYSVFLHQSATQAAGT